MVYEDLATLGCAVNLSSCLSPHHVVCLAGVSSVIILKSAEQTTTLVKDFCIRVQRRATVVGKRLQNEIRGDRRVWAVLKPRERPRSPGNAALPSGWPRLRLSGVFLRFDSEWEGWPLRILLHKVSWVVLKCWLCPQILSNGRSFWSSSFKAPVCMVVTCFLRRDGLSKCGKCKQAYYCNVECQVGLEDGSLYALTEFAVPATWNIWLCSVCIQFLSS